MPGDRIGNFSDGRIVLICHNNYDNVQVRIAHLKRRDSRIAALVIYRPVVNSPQSIHMDVHTESISIAVRNSVGKVVMECVIETNASTIVQFIDGLVGDLRVTFEEGAWAAWLYAGHWYSTGTPSCPVDSSTMNS